MIQYPPRSLPILRECDILIAGGSLAGTAAALVAARNGKRVVVVEPRTYLGREITAELRPWLETPEETPYSTFTQALVDATGAPPVGREVPLRLDALKIFLEDSLIQAGVGLLYASYPVQVLQEGSRVSGLVIGNKSGRQVILCATLVDATETALVSRLAGAAFEPPVYHAECYRRTLEFSLREPMLEAREMDLEGSHLTLHLGAGGLHAYVEAEFIFTSGTYDYDDRMDQELSARQKSMQLSLALIDRLPEFRGAQPGVHAYELHGRKARRFARTPSMGTNRFSEKLFSIPQNNRVPFTVGADSFAGPLENLWCLNDAAHLPEAAGDGFLNPVVSVWLGEALGDLLAGKEIPLPSGQNPLLENLPAHAGPAIREQPAPQQGRPYAMQVVPAQPVPAWKSGDVLVAGGGTSGAVAAAAAAREGAQAVLVDMNPGLGGTGTLGGVPEYWMGEQHGFTAEIAEKAREIDQKLGFVPPDPWHHWSIEGKMHVTLEMLLKAGVDIHFYAMCIGTITQADRVLGVVTATPYGPLAFLADVTVDATGDGDIAAFAGAEYVYGSERDHTAMWYSLSQIGLPGITLSGNFTSMCDVSNVEDYTRAILAGRRRRSGIHDHGVYLAPRESRHILADVVISYTDLLLQRRWPDVVNVFYSNYDIKGKPVTDWNLIGLISANLEVEFPYRALLPRRLDGILVTGKAFSAGSDAAPLIRMQSDLENLGGVTGLAAALSARAGSTPRALPVRLLQERLVAMGLLPADILTRVLEPRRLSPAELRGWIDRLDDRPLYDLNNRPGEERFHGRIPIVEVCTAGPQAIPLLAQALETAEGPRQVLVAQALALCGDPTGAPVLVEAIQTALGETGLPPRSAHILNAVKHMPDQGAMPEPAYLVYSLGMTRSRAVLQICQTIAGRLDFSDTDFRDPNRSPYHYIDAVCYSLERLGDPRGIPILQKIHGHPLLHDQVCLQGVQADYMIERLGTLELVISRALARCGSPQGYSTLIAYLDDVRAPLAEHAHAELVSITGQDFGKNSAAWHQWLEQEKGHLAPRPWMGPTDAQRAWDSRLEFGTK